MPALVLVVPCYNEAERLPRYLPHLAAALADTDCLLQVVDDGSRSPEVAAIGRLVDEWRRRLPDRIAPLLALPANQGKGAAIRAGWRAHPGSRLLGFVDADGAISPPEVRRVVDLAFATPGDAFFASRVKMLGRRVDRTFTRHLMGRVFATAASLRLNIPVYDTQCGLKIIPGPVFDHSTAAFAEDGFAFDLELLVALLDQGYSIQEIPIDWTHIAGSKIHFVRDSIRIYSSLERIAHHRPKWTSPNKIN